MNEIQRQIIKENEKVIDTGEVQVIVINEDDIEKSVQFYLDGVLHREGDLPAVYDLEKGMTEWFIKGKRHRENNLPAVLHSIGLFEFWLNGKRHRTNGPAIHHLGMECNIWVREFDSCIVNAKLEDPESLYGAGTIFVENEFWLHGKKISQNEL